VAKRGRPTNEEARVAELSVKEKGDLIEFGKGLLKEENEKLKEKLSLSPWIFEMAGKIEGMMFTEVQARCFKVLFLKKVKEAKDYREIYGMTWEQFCEHLKISKRTADSWLDELGPFTTEFLANFANFSGYDLNKFKYLALAKLANIANFGDNSIIHKGEEIPLTDEFRDQIHAAFADIIDELKKLHEDRDLERRTHDRRLAEDRKHREKLEHALSKLEKEAARKGMSAEDDAFLKQMEIRRRGFDGYMMGVDPQNFLDAKEKGEFSPRMVASYLSTLDYMRKQILAAYDTAIQIYGNPVIAPEKAWRPGVTLS
jgi:transcriptional regulator with XRE-family HTH domain